MVSIPMNKRRENGLTQRCQCANHEDSYNETVPETTEPNVFVNPAHGSSESLSGLAAGVELAHHDISGMRHNGTENTG